MTTLSDSVDDQVFKHLLNLVKIEKDKTNSNVDAGKEGKFKQMYRDARVQNDVQGQRH